MFSKFKELKTKEEQATSEELAKHATKVMETMDESIRSLDELDVFFQYLNDIGASHVRVPGFSSDLFWVSLRKIINKKTSGIFNEIIKMHKFYLCK